MTDDRGEDYTGDDDFKVKRIAYANEKIDNTLMSVFNMKLQLAMYVRGCV